MSRFMNKKYDLLFIFAILITGIIAYSNSFDCSFHFDDAIFFTTQCYDRFSENR